MTDIPGPFLDNGWVNTFRQQEKRNATIEDLSSIWSVLRCCKLSLVEFCTGVYEERTWAHEAEESPLLEAVVRERLVKIKQAGKGLAGGVMICELWEIIGGAVIASRSESINPFTNPNPVSTHAL
jgi:hypothetical protein